MMKLDDAHCTIFPSARGFCCSFATTHHFKHVKENSLMKHRVFLFFAFFTLLVFVFPFAVESSASVQPDKDRSCALTHFNASLARHLPLVNLASFKPLGDLQRKLFAAETWDDSQGSFMLSLYDLGKDAVFSDDDTVTPLGPTSSSSTTSPLLQISRHPSTGKESLFWVTRGLDLSTTIFSCALPDCAYPTKEATFQNYHLFVMTPSLQHQKILFLLMDKTTNDDVLLSCSFNISASDWCGLDEGNYTVHRRSNLPSLEMQSVRDQGIAWKQTFSGNYFFFPLLTQNIISLPAGVQMRTVGNFLGTSQALFYRQYRQEGISTSVLSMIDLATGGATTMETLPLDLSPLLVDVHQSNIYTFYFLDGVYTKKHISQPSTVVFPGDLHLWHVKHVTQLSNGMIIAVVAQARLPLDVVGFTCTP